MRIYYSTIYVSNLLFGLIFPVKGRRGDAPHATWQYVKPEQIRKNRQPRATELAALRQQLVEAQKAATIADSKLGPQSENWKSSAKDSRINAYAARRSCVGSIKRDLIRSVSWPRHGKRQNS